MPADVTVRRIRADEGLRWRALRLRALADSPVAFVDTVEQASARPDSDWHDRVRALSAGCRSALFVAESTGAHGDDAWVGVAGGFADEAGNTTVFTVFIDPAMRGQGILEKLIAAVAEWSIGCGRTMLSLEVAVQNPRAHAAYKRLGFVPTGRSRPHPLFPDVVEVEMTRPAAMGVRIS